MAEMRGNRGAIIVRKRKEIMSGCKRGRRRCVRGVIGRQKRKQKRKKNRKESQKRRTEKKGPEKQKEQTTTVNKDNYNYKNINDERRYKNIVDLKR